MSEEVYKRIDRILFSLLSPSEIRKMSVAEITTPDTYDEDGVPIPSGLMDERLGTLEPRQKCKTCGNTAALCPGHFGHIELAEPVVHISFVKLIHKLLAITCRDCGRIRLPTERIEEYRKRIEEEKNLLNAVSDSLYESIMKEAKKSSECPHCGSRQYPIEHEKPTSFYEIVDGGAVKLRPTLIRERLERIPDEDLRLIGINPETARPEWAILQVLPVPPVSVRPSITLESGIRSEDDLTHKLVDIIRINQKLKEAIDSGVPVNIIEELHDLLQYHVTTFFDNEVSGIPPARHRSGRALKTLAQRLKGKEGRFRGNLSGKRVDFSARTVISPDPNLDIDMVGVPVEIASKLTVPERITEWNIEYARKLIENGPEKYPGALYIVRGDGRRIRLEFVSDRKELAEAIQPGFILERHIRDGDIVLFNRQPSLHRMSIMAHRVKVLPYKTFRLNPCVCPPYNADFDGDEMNLHVPQSEEAITEADLLARVRDQILSPRYGGPIIGAKTDLITAAYLLTKEGTYLTKEEVGILLVAANYEGDLPPPKDTKNRLWSGKQIFSLFLPKGLYFSTKSNLCSIYKCEKCLEERCEYDAFVIVKDGKLIKGVIDKNSIGAEKSDTLFHRIVKDYGSDVAAKFLNSISKLLDRFLTLKGFTYSIDELDLPDQVRARIDKVIEKAEGKVASLIEAYRSGTLERLPGQSLEETLEIHIMNELSKARDQAGEYAEAYFGMENSGIIMTRTGARGSMLNIGQMTACLGQQSIRGKRILRGYRDRTLPFFEWGDAGAAARGFVYSSYREGLNPIEFFFHAMGGREGLVDTAVRTQQSGYMQRRLVNALEHIRVEYDNTVRDPNGNIIQFKYGEDGTDTSKSDRGKSVNVDRVIEKVKLTMGKGRRATKEYVIKKLSQYKDRLTPKLVDELRSKILGSKLTREAVDEVVEEVVRKYESSLIEPGEASGMVSAQSIGEPGTQMTLRTFHFAGVREQNVTLGLPRLIEIVDARKTPSTPTMTVYLDKEHRTSKEKAEKVASRITHTTLGDIASSIESDLTEMKVIVRLDPNAMRERGVTISDLQKSIRLGLCDVKFHGLNIDIIAKNMELPQFRKLQSRIEALHVKGIPTVKRALVVEENGEWVLKTEGSGLAMVLRIPGVDPTRTISNDIHEVAAVLGIEAARNVIIKEAMSVLEEQGLDVDIRHVMLMADVMTASGRVLQVGRHGVTGEKASPLAKAAFEITVPTIVEAALKGDEDFLKGVAENVIVGQQIPMGTGLIDLYMFTSASAEGKG